MSFIFKCSHIDYSYSEQRSGFLLFIFMTCTVYLFIHHNFYAIMDIFKTFKSTCWSTNERGGGEEYGASKVQHLLVVWKYCEIWTFWWVRRIRQWQSGFLRNEMSVTKIPEANLQVVNIIINNCRIFMATLKCALLGSVECFQSMTWHLRLVWDMNWL